MRKIAFILLLSSTAFCSGPFYIYPPDKGGTACKWKNGVVKWYYDDGDLSKEIKNQPKNDSSKKACDKKAADGNYHWVCKNMKMCGITMCVELLFNEWQNDAELMLGDNETTVKAVEMGVTEKGAFGEDINSGNFSLENGLDKNKVKSSSVVIVYDENGDIFKKAGREPEDPSANYAVTNVNCGSDGYYTSGWMVLNPYKSSDELFYASILHEIGHVFGLDHSQPANGVLKSDLTAIVDDTGIQTMYPWLTTSESKNADETEPMADLHKDDIIGLARLYPSKFFKSNFCTVEGVLKDADGNPYPGINVIAYPEGESSPYADSVTFVSGALEPACTHSGKYLLPGLVPGRPYNISYEPVLEQFRNFENGMNPYVGTVEDPGCSLLPSASEEGGAMVTADGNSLIACDVKLSDIDKKYMTSDGLLTSALSVSADDVSIYDKNTIDIQDTTLTTKPGTQAVEEKKKGWCMSVAGGFEPGMGIGILGVIAVLWRRRTKALSF